MSAPAKENATAIANLPRQKLAAEIDPALRVTAIRTAFIARFIVLREGRRSKAHRVIEKMTWESQMTARELAKKIRQAFIDNGDKLQPVDRDILRALKHAERSTGYFFEEYINRSTLSFTEALADYERSNKLLFGECGEDVPRIGGWKLQNQKNGNDGSEE